MGAVSKIAWTTSTFNPWIGCARVSPGCEHCYAETQDNVHRYGGQANWGARAPRYGVKESYWNGPAKWERAAVAAGERRRVFCGSMCDWLEDRPDVVERRLRLMREIIPATPHLDWLLLTKRPENAARLVLPEWTDGAWPKNAWFGFTGENQEWFDRRWKAAREVPAPLIWCSYEPALGPIDFRAAVDPICECPDGEYVAKQYGHTNEACPSAGRRLSWVIFGGESGAGARPCSLSWGRAARDQCRAAGVPFFHKQTGVVPMDAGLGGELVALGRPRSRAGEDPAEWPADLCVREFPPWPKEAP